MAEAKKHEKHAEHDGSWVERRFTAEPTSRTNWLALLGGLGGVTLGAGTFASFLHDPPLPVGNGLLVAGAIATGVSLFVRDSSTAPLRVGALGVGIERDSSQPVRVAWCDIERIRWDERAEVLIVEAGAERIVISEAGHGAALAWVVHEALERIPSRVEMPAERAQSFATRANPHEGEVLQASRPQVAGRRCKASGAIVTFENDAHLCEQCGQVYHREHVPERCLTCDAPLEALALQRAQAG
jgi:hypothetical protein